MERPRSAKGHKHQPGVWSTDDYIRAWALQQGHAAGSCIVPLQSLHGFWSARVDFDQPGRPVERFADEEPTASDDTESSATELAVHA
ncbi:hypothetical protein EGT07_10765 [Herbaspirillum sp. HC18]|nr:hypothetical protein EGT07_10765 [Herbaspirillum sp. HC18]